MRKYILAILISCLFGISGCYEDNSTLATVDSTLPEIIIGELNDTSVVAYSTVLNITPDVRGYAESELTYAWYIYGGEFGDQTAEGYRTVKVGENKALSYEITLKQGDYTLVFEATSKKSGYAVTKEMGMKVQTPFSQGFYILKETAGGNTELDIYNMESKELRPDILALTQGQTLAGAPRTLSVVYNKAYVDPETAESGDMISAFIAYGQNGMACFRTEDMMKIFDRSSILFSEAAEDEIPYCMATAAMVNFYFTSKGVRLEGNSGNTYGTGKLAYPVGNDGSSLIQACDGRGLLYWDLQHHCLMYASDGGTVREVNYLGNEFTWGNVEAIATGWNYLSGTNTIWYILEDRSGERFLIHVDKGGNVSKVHRLEPALHISKASIIAGNGKTSYSIYAVDNNGIYRYSMGDGNETTVYPEGLPASVNITFLSDIYFSNEFNYLIIGIQNGEEYFLYMYEIIGGLPYGAPVHVAKGQGKLKDVRYVSGSSPDTPNLFPFYGYMSQNFPY